MMHSCSVYTERAEMAAVSRGTGHVTTKQRCKCTTLADIHSFENHMRQERSESPRERRTARYIKEIVHHSITVTHLLSPSTIPTQGHIYGHRPLSQHSDIIIVTIPTQRYPYRHRPLFQLSDTCIVTVHYHLSSPKTTSTQ